MLVTEFSHSVTYKKMAPSISQKHNHYYSRLNSRMYEGGCVSGSALVCFFLNWRYSWIELAGLNESYNMTYIPISMSNLFLCSPVAFFASVTVSETFSFDSE